MDWLAALRGLRDDAVRVEHDPRTPRYVRAASKLAYVLRTAEYLGEQPGRRPGSVEVATWSPPGHGRGSGFYCCFRLLLEEDVVVEAVLWCFYDGTQGSPVGLRSVEEARAFARHNHFEVTEHGTDDSD